MNKIKRKDFNSLIDHPGTVCGLCITKDENILLINTKRFSQNEYWEFAGGILENDIDIQKELEREVLEETGYKVLSSEFMIEFNTSVGITNEKVYLFNCLVEKTMINKEFNVREISFNELSNLIEQKQIKDSKTIIGFSLMQKTVSKHQHIYSRILTTWSIQDNLLQMYRSIFLTSQSVIFSIAVYIGTTEKPFFIILLFLIGLYLLWFMDKLTHKRGYGIWYCQLHLMKIEKGDYFTHSNFFSDFNRFMQMNGKEMKQQLANDKTGKGKFDNNTRKKMEVLTFIFLTLWIALIIITFIIKYNKPVL